VLEKMLESGSVLGGEQSGHIIFSNISPTGDGLLSTLELLKVLIDDKKDPARIYDIFPRYPQLLKNIRVKNKSKILGSEAVRSKVLEMEDMLGPDGRILLRPSGTEPVIRVMAEAKTMDMVNRAVEELTRLIEDCNRKIK
jgi:phosphoglucosamine mutase